MTLQRGSLALSLIRSSGETRAHLLRTTLRFVYVGLRPRSGSARPALLLISRNIYEISSFQLISSAKLVLAYIHRGSLFIPAILYQQPLIARHFIDKDKLEYDAKLLQYQLPTQTIRTTRDNLYPLTNPGDVSWYIYKWMLERRFHQQRTSIYLK